MVPWNGPRAKVQIKLSIQRLRTLQEKKLALAKASRRDIADLLNKGRVETAKLRTEGMIQDDIYVELLEVLELYAEMLQARFNLLEASTGTEPEPSISDAVCAIVYAAPRTELKELQVLREILMHKFGRNFSLSLQQSDPPPATVPVRVLSKLALFTPSKELVDAYLGEIARGYGVAWTPESSNNDTAAPEDDEDGGIEPLKRDGETEADDKDKDGGDGDAGGGEKDAKGGSRDQKTTVKDDGEKQKQKEDKTSPVKQQPTAIPPPASATPAPAKKLTEEEELAQRFEKLKNLR
ncbi:hypothetical protein I316_04788 [Kwoniella heveanensis BCC8398]|uniref:DUF292-domain-containing protein n=1 Tax=Kwoniella heveanensis BCC8398 TaxID=1296120 RepID=A0A1B9GQK1_9TREE|nr:hypothetical protein I316_04788 [Kwoniella heveanensis BCC8398]